MADAPISTSNAQSREEQSNKRGRGGHNNSRGRGNSQGGNFRGRQDRNGFRGKGQKREKDLGRKDWSRQRVDKRGRNDDQRDAKRRRTEGEGGTPETAWAKAHAFTEEEINAEARRPKRKVAVMIGYSGAGYKGMQINLSEKTIEGDLFKGLVAAGAISKANADDPKKSSLVRCARTDKNVSAAGNMISLKLIVEDEDIVQKINDNLPSQIRVWGIERTNGAFSCYQVCDSRWYEYLIPTYSFLPPHPRSYLGKKLEEVAQSEGKYDEYKARQEDVAGFWEEVEKTHIEPILQKLDPELREAVLIAIHAMRDEEEVREHGREGGSDNAADVVRALSREGSPVPESIQEEAKAMSPGPDTKPEEAQLEGEPRPKRVLTPLELALKEVKAAYVTAKKAYRISKARHERVQEALNQYVGTVNFHNYTIQKRYQDPSSRRYIKSFKVNPEPIIINDTEWLSMKVHGQSFMMHQIRKMVGMAALVVRCGTPMSVMKDSFGPQALSIPKAPGVGLLLERPVFDNYNSRCKAEYDKDPLEFDKYEKEIEAFKHREIYSRIFAEEQQDNKFHVFFHHIDNFKSGFFLWTTAAGLKAAQTPSKKGEKEMEKVMLGDASDEEPDVNGEEG